MTDNNAVILPATVVIDGIKGLNKVLDAATTYTNKAAEDLIREYGEVFEAIVDRADQSNKLSAELVLKAKQADAAIAQSLAALNAEVSKNNSEQARYAAIAKQYESVIAVNKLESQRQKANDERLRSMDRQITAAKIEQSKINVLQKRLDVTERLSDVDTANKIKLSSQKILEAERIAAIDETKQLKLMKQKKEDSEELYDKIYFNRRNLQADRHADDLEKIRIAGQVRDENIRLSWQKSDSINTKKFLNTLEVDAKRFAAKKELQTQRSADRIHEMERRAELSQMNKLSGASSISGIISKLGEKALPVLSSTFTSFGEKLNNKASAKRGGVDRDDWIYTLFAHKDPGKRLDFFGDMFKKLGGALSKVSIGAMAAGVGILVAGVTFVSKKILKVGKTIVSYFANIAKQAETVKALMELIALPFKIIFTLMAVPLLTAFIPVLEKMLQWISDNQDTIQAIGETLAKIFTEVFKPETMEIVTHLLNGFATVLNFLATSIAENMKSVNTNSVASFIASTITAITGVIQDVLMGLVAFCYSAEGQAFIVSLSESIGRIIGTLVVLLIEMIPVFLEILVVTVVGIIKGMWDVLVKQIASILDIIDGVTGGMFTNMANGIINVVNWFIDRINSVIGFLNNFGVGIGQMQHIDTWSYGGVGSNFGNAATSFTNSTSISSVFNITNNNNVSNSDTMKAIFMTGGM